MNFRKSTKGELHNALGCIFSEINGNADATDSKRYDKITKNTEDGKPILLRCWKP